MTQNMDIISLGCHDSGQGFLWLAQWWCGGPSDAPTKPARDGEEIVWNTGKTINSKKKNST